MRASELRKLGIPDGPLMRRAQKLCGTMASEDLDKDEMRSRLGVLAEHPDKWTDDETLGDFAADLVEWNDKAPRDEPVDYDVWGDDIDPQAINQIEDGCRIPVVEEGAVMPDAHRGYSVPIGGVLAAKGVMPGAIGVDIACRMKLSVTSLRADEFDDIEDELSEALEEETSFGMGSGFEKPRRRDHEVLEDSDWSVSSVVRGQKDKAWRQLGSSGSGNHFAEWGIIKIGDVEELDIEPGEYVALLTHSGSRGPGASVSNHYVEKAAEQRPELPDQLQKLAWFELGTSEAEEFLTAMNLMGRFASACHETIHDTVIGEFDEVEVLTEVENHHNFAWIEEIDGEEYVVHRKGATPAAEGQLGVIPGTMVDSAYVVRGKGNRASINSAAHGAGRVMSRTAARKTLSHSDHESVLEENDVRLLSSGLDEAPQVYKDIDTVMAHQRDLVEPLAEFQPRIVKMAPPNEPSWENEEE